MATVEDEAFMLACLKLAKTYVKVVSEELRLYSSKAEHKPIEISFVVLQQALDERVQLHTERLERARNPALFVEKPKVKLKQRAPEPEKVVSKNKIPARKLRLKKRMV